MGNSSDIDISIAALYEAWRLFRRGKRAGRHIVEFEYNLEKELMCLAYEIAQGAYRHSSYEKFVVNDNKRRLIAVAAVRDRVVHRLLYEYLVQRYDKMFVYDAWSCRPRKGIDGAISRVQQHMRAYRDGWLWRSDIRKFFDHVDHEVLLELISRRVTGSRAIWLMRTVVESYDAGKQAGLAIGNLTSQICANIYMHEYDRFVAHELHPLGYVRYGDDMVLWAPNEQEARDFADRSQEFLARVLHLAINPQSTVLQPACRKLHYLGVEFWPSGHRLDARMRSRLVKNVGMANYASYDALALSRSARTDLQAIRQRMLESSNQ